MPTIPLYQTPADVDAWHDVQAPGGCEWWNFEAAGDDGQLDLSAVFFDGDPVSAAYLHAFKKYLRAPTKFAPPTANAFPRVTISIDRPRKSRQIYHGNGAFAGSTERLELQVGQDSVRTDAAGVTHLAAGDRNRTAIDLQFIGRPMQPTIVTLHANHRWILAAPRGPVAGTVWIAGQPSPFAGVGYHDHYVSIAGPPKDIASWFGGRLFTDDGVVAFHMLTFVGGEERAAVRLAHIADEGAERLDVTNASMDMKPDWPWKPAFPLRVELGDLVLTKPRLTTDTPHCLNLIYDATFRGHHGRAACEIMYPQR